jgi:hypothetical protein
MNVLCLIASPPDCTFYCTDMVQRYPDWNFIFLYYKNYWRETGNKEIQDFWKNKKVKLIFCSNNEMYYQNKFNEITNEIEIDIILTYNDFQKTENTEFKFLNDLATSVSIPKIFYGTEPPFVNTVYTHDKNLVDIAEFPTFDWMHLWDYTTFRYLITDEAQEDVIDPWLWNKTFFGNK